MRHFVTLALCLILLMGGFCSYTCFAEIEHQCCHDTPTVSSQQSHPAVPVIQTIPALPEIGFVLYNPSFASSQDALTTPFKAFAPPLPPLILRL